MRLFRLTYFSATKTRVDASQCAATNCRVAQAHAPEARGVHFTLSATAIFALGLAFVVALSTAAFVVRPARAADRVELSRWAGDSKPPFALDDLERRSVALAAGDAGITIVHFFATWCDPCREELPALRRLVERADPADVRVLTISVAEVGVRVRNFVDKHPVNFPILLDRDRGVARAWNVSALPTTFILGRDLQPRLYVEQDYDWDTFDIPAALRDFASSHPPQATTTNVTSITKGDKP